MRGQNRNVLGSLNPLYIVECFRSSRLSRKNSQLSLNPLYIVECFRRVASPRPYKSRVPEGVFLPDFLSTTFESTFSEGFFSNSLIFNEVA